MRDWLKDLDAKDRRTIGMDLKDVEYGWPVGMPLCRSLGNGLWEVRSSLSHGCITRVIFCVEEGEMILLHGVIKKTQKTLQQDIDLALKRKKRKLRIMKKEHIGSSLDAFLEEEGLLDEAAARAQKKALAWQLDQAVKARGFTKAEMARRMKTSRAQLDRLLDPAHTTVKLETVQRAAAILGKSVSIDLVDVPGRA